MATVREFITAKLERFNIELSTAEMDALVVDQGLNLDAAYNSSTATIAKKAILEIIPELLLSPDVREGGYSQSWDTEGIKAYYNMLCAELKVPNKLIPKVTDKSYMW